MKAVVHDAYQYGRQSGPAEMACSIPAAASTSLGAFPVRIAAGGYMQ